MSENGTTFPIGHRIERVGGLAVGVNPETEATKYVGLLGLEDGSAAGLHVDHVERFAQWPHEGTDMPLHPPGCEAELLGAEVTNGIRRELSGSLVDHQVFLILNGSQLFGLLPDCGGGTLLHLGALASASFLEQSERLTLFTGEELTPADFLTSVDAAGRHII